MAVLPSTPALGAVSCTFDPIKGLVTVSAPTQDDQVVILRGDGDEILVNADTCPGGGTIAATSNTNGITVNGSAASGQWVVIDLTGGSFGGIAFALVMGDGSGDGLGIVGGGGGEILFVGATSFWMDEVTSSHSGVERVGLHGGAGHDTLSLAGSMGDPAFAGEGVLLGQDGHDTLIGGDGPDDLRGGTGRDLVSYAGRIDDLTLSADGVADDGAIAEGDNIRPDVESLEGGDGNDVIEPPTASAGSLGGLGHCDPAAAKAGRPEVCGGGGNDRFPLPLGIRVAGGSGSDEVDFSDSPASRTHGVVIYEDGAEHYGWDSDASVGSDVERIIGTPWGDVLSGGDGPNELIGGLGADLLDGGGGADWARYRSRTTGVVVSLAGGAGEDTLVDIENVEGGNGGDHIIGDENANVLHGGYGVDDIGDDIDGGPGADTILGGWGSDTLSGGEGRDTLAGGPRDDVLGGGGDNDVLDGGSGADVMTGGGGDRDKVTYESRTARVVVTLRSGDDDGEAGEGDFVSDDVEWVIGGSGNDEFVSASRGLGGTVVDNTFVGNGGADTLKGGDGEDVIYGWEGNDEILGGGGADWLYGGRNVDTIKGEGDADRIFGGQHGDTLKGNSGNDTFFAEDGFPDDVIGGTGTDTAHADAFDGVRRCEIVD